MTKKKQTPADEVKLQDLSQEQLVALVEKQAAIITELESDVENLNGLLHKYESGQKKASLPTVKVDGKVYDITGKAVKIGDKEYSASDIQENKIEVSIRGKKGKLADMLVSIGSGLLIAK